MGLFHLLQFKFINNDSKCQEFIRRTFQVKKNEPNLSSFENLYPLYHTRCNLPIPKTKKKRRVRSTRQYSTTSQSETSTEVRMG